MQQNLISNNSVSYVPIIDKIKFCAKILNIKNVNFSFEKYRQTSMILHKKILQSVKQG